MHAQAEVTLNKMLQDPEDLPDEFVSMIVNLVHEVGYFEKKGSYELTEVSAEGWKRVCWHVQIQTGDGESDWKCYDLGVHEDGRTEICGPVDCPGTPSTEDSKR